MEKTKINQKEAGVGPFLKKFTRSDGATKAAFLKIWLFDNWAFLKIWLLEIVLFENWAF